MHVGNINKGTAAGRLYRVLKLHLGEWMDAFELAMEARTTCLNGQRKQFYRMVRYASA